MPIAKTGSDNGKRRFPKGNAKNENDEKEKKENGKTKTKTTDSEGKRNGVGEKLPPPSKKSTAVEKKKLSTANNINVNMKKSFSANRIKSNSNLGLNIPDFAATSKARSNINKNSDNSDNRNMNICVYDRDHKRQIALNSDNNCHINPLSLSSLYVKNVLSKNILSSSNIYTQVFANGHGRSVLCLAVNNTGDYVVSGSSDHGLRVFRLTDLSTKTRSSAGHFLGELYATKYGHTEWVSLCKFLPNNKIISCGFDGKICVWNSEILCPFSSASWVIKRKNLIKRYNFCCHQPKPSNTALNCIMHNNSQKNIDNDSSGSIMNINEGIVIAHHNKNNIAVSLPAPTVVCKPSTNKTTCRDMNDKHRSSISCIRFPDFCHYNDDDEFDSDDCDDYDEFKDGSDTNDNCSRDRNNTHNTQNASSLSSRSSLSTSAKKRNHNIENFITSGYDGVLKLWSLKTFDSLRTYICTGLPMCPRIPPAITTFIWINSLIVSGNKEGGIYIYDVDKERPLYGVNNVHNGPISLLLLLLPFKKQNKTKQINSNDDEFGYLISCGLGDGSICVSNVKNFRKEAIKKHPIHKGAVNGCMQIYLRNSNKSNNSDNFGVVCTYSADGYAYIWDFESFGVNCFSEYPCCSFHTGSPILSAKDIGSGFIALGCANGNIYIADIEDNINNESSSRRNISNFCWSYECDSVGGVNTLETLNFLSPKNSTFYVYGLVAAGDDGHVTQIRFL